MRAAAPAPVSTATSRPSVLNFLIDSGVAATRVSPVAVSLRTASFIANGRSAVGPENGQEHHDQQNPNQGVFGEGEKTGIAAQMLADIHRAGLIIGIV